MSRLVVLDTNCLVQMISVHSPYRPAWQAFRDGKYTLCVSNEILNEYQEILERVANSFVAKNIVEAIINSPFCRFYTHIFILALFNGIMTTTSLSIAPSKRVQIT